MDQTPRFEKAFDELLGIEGGYNNIAEDRGGATKYGISLRFLRSRYPDATEADIRALPIEAARALYFDHFWKPSRAESLPAGVGEAHFTNYVNMSPTNATLILQRAINRAAPAGGKITVDGHVGPRTISAAAGANQRELKRRLVAELCAFYYQISKANSDFERTFLNGWFYRAASLFIT